MTNDAVRPARPGSHIAMYLPTMAGGGGERVFAMLSGAFVERGHKVSLLLNKAEGPNLAHVHPAVRVVDLHAPRSVMAIPRIAGFIRRNRPDVLLSGLGVSNVIAVAGRALAAAPTAIVISIHSLLSSQIWPGDNWQYKTLRWVAPFAYPKADGIIVISDAVAEDLASITTIGRSRMTRIHNPLAPDVWTQAEEPLDDPWFNDPDTPVLLGVGRFVPAKDFATLLRAFASVRERRATRLVILGEGQLRGDLTSLAKALGVAEHVRMPGYVTNPFPYMRQAAVFVLSSANEGFGNVIIEALACGTPVVSTEAGGAAAEILDGSSYGALVPVGDAAAMASAIEETLDHPPAKSALVARAKDFELLGVADQYLEVLLEDAPRRAAEHRAGFRQPTAAAGSST